MLINRYEKDNIALSIFVDDTPINPRSWDNLGRMVCFHRQYNIGDNHNYSNHMQFFKDVIISEIDTFKILEGIVKKLVTFKKTDEGIEVSYNGDFFDTYSNTSHETIIEDIINDMYNNLDYYLSESEMLEIIENNTVILPVYLYDHSIQCLSTHPFVGRALHAEWDSGQVGWIYTTHEDIKNEFGKVNDEVISRVVKNLEGEVKTYNHYMNGDVYGYKLEKKEVCEYCDGVEYKEVASCWGFYGNNFKEHMKECIPDEYHELLDRVS